MIGYILIVLFTLINLGESVIVRTYGRKHGSGGLILSAITSLFAAIFFIVTDKGGFYAPAEMLILAVINACLIGVGFYGSFVAYQSGPYGLIRLISGFNLVFTIFYGIVFLKEPTSALTYIGIAMVIAAMVLINYKKATKRPKRAVRLNGFSGCWHQPLQTDLSVSLPDISRSDLKMPAQMNFSLFHSSADLSYLP